VSQSFTDSQAVLTRLVLLISCSSNSAKHSRPSAKDTDSFTVPVVDMAAPGVDPDQIEPTYRSFQVLHLRNVTVKQTSSNPLRWQDLNGIFRNLNDHDKESWCIETKGGENSLSPNQFLSPLVTKDRAYCSFLVQKDKTAYEATVHCLPCQEIPLTQWKYEPALWMFFGRNPLGNVSLDGRPEHTDSVTFDGTFHFQLSGVKIWSLRPTPELVSHVNCRFPEMHFSQDTRVQISCKEGDVIVVNTRLWFHCTVIPPQVHPSVSYARDFRFQSVEPDESQDKEEGGMKNLDGLYATNDILKGTVIFSESEMPDCELHRSSSNPNCEVVELEDGTNAVVSCRRIAAGEFFCVAESSDESESLDESLED